ncbi:dymeclin family protein, putative [Bodo saltans]|uniref:Dymeclin family protein, putative n=1 Tax=Bodo saltans TaxID=75058 RepID=A0A0S4IV42_BODSA|nr:dymeclin family protein, putative [Bodo saltans]|eukprot:CUF04657.1 dymeclin family protein, putative [Bodo saltans]
MGNSSSSLALIAALRTIGEPSSSVTKQQQHSSSLLEDHELWRSLFTATFTIIVMSSQYLRTLRLVHPDRLAALLFKCISQLHAFAFEHGEDGASIAAAKKKESGEERRARGAGIKKQRPSPQSVLNALLILQHTLPVVFENADDAMQLLQEGVSRGGGGGGSGATQQQQQPIVVSPFGKDFLAHVFLNNRTCAAAAAAASPSTSANAEVTSSASSVFPHLSFPTLSRVAPSSPSSTTNATIAGDGGFVPLGTLLMECLVRLCFVPEFTIPTPTMTTIVADAAHNQEDHKSSSSAFDVVPELLWCQGIVGNRKMATTITAEEQQQQQLPKWGPSAHLFHHLNEAFFSSMSDYRRQVLLTLNTVLTLPLHRHRCIEEEPIFLTPLTRQVTLFPTLVASLVNNLVLYDPRGRMPYSSHMITTSEHVVVLGVQFLNISLDYSGLLLGATSTPSTQVAATPQQPQQQQQQSVTVGGDHSEANAEATERISHHQRSRLSAARRSSLSSAAATANDDARGMMEQPETSTAAALSSPSAVVEVAHQDPARRREEDYNSSTSASADKLFAHQTALSNSAKKLQKSAMLSEHRTLSELVAEDALCRNTGWALLCQHLSSVEAQWIVNGLALLFGNVTRAKSTFLPQSQRTIFEHDLLLVLLWKLIDRSAPIRSAFGGDNVTNSSSTTATSGANNNSTGPTAYVVPLCYYLTTGRTNPGAAAPRKRSETTSLSQIAMFIFLKLSGERSFVLACNEPFTEHLPFALPEVASANGTYNDVIALACLSVLQDAEMNSSVVDGTGGERRAAPKHRPMHASCVTVLANIAPFMQSVSLGTTMRMLRMLELFGRPSFLLESPVEHGKWLMLIIEALCSLLQYQFRGCGHLSYALVRSRDVVYTVLDLFDDTEVLQTEQQPAVDNSREVTELPTSHSLTAIPPTTTAAPPRMSLSELSHPDDPNRGSVIEHRKSLLFTLRCALGALEVIVLPLVQSTRVGVAEIPTIISQKSTLVGALPVPHSIVVRGFPSSYSVDEWVSKALWGFIFSHAVPGALVRSTKAVKLFTFA